MKRRGFTLIEVLLATSLSTVIALAVASVLSTQMTARKRIHERSDRRALLSSVDRRLRADLRAVVPPGGLYAAGLVGQDEVSAGGGEDLLPAGLQGAAAQATTPNGEPVPLDQRDQLVLAVWPGASAFGEELEDGQGALWQVTYRIDDDPETEERGLVREVARVRDLAVGTDPEPVEQLCPEVIAMNVTYFDGQDWQETWDSGASDTLPTAVAIDLVFVRDERVFVYRVHVSTLQARASQLPEAGQ